MVSGKEEYEMNGAVDTTKLSIDEDKAKKKRVRGIYQLLPVNFHVLKFRLMFMLRVRNYSVELSATAVRRDRKSTLS